MRRLATPDVGRGARCGGLTAAALNAAVLNAAVLTAAVAAGFTPGCAVDVGDPAGCETLDDCGAHRLGLAKPGPWEIPLTTLAIGDGQQVPYTGAGPWRGESGCSGSLTDGAALLRDFLGSRFPQVWHVGGYACRGISGSSSMSVHGLGRALDVHIETVAGDEADNDAGDPVGNFLIENAEAFGIQYIIWDRGSWRASRDVGAKYHPYTGDHPHHDHLHVELSVAASAGDAPFYRGDWRDTGNDPCPTLGPDGGLVDDEGPCFAAFGPSAYWRRTADLGIGTGVLWTNAYQAEEPSNWARWRLLPERPGRYRVEVSVPPELGRHRRTHYELLHADRLAAFYVDQSSPVDGFVTLGEVDFAADGNEQLAVYDNATELVADEQHIVVDAVRLTALDGSGELPPESPIPTAPPTSPPLADAGAAAQARGELAGGCSLTPGAPATRTDASDAIVCALGGFLLASGQRRRRLT